MDNIKLWEAPKVFSKEDYFQLLSHCYEELKHRDELFWKQIFAYFYATLIVSVLPTIRPLGLQLPEGMP